MLEHQVQNKKLSERLKERNFAREQLEARVEEAESRVEDQRRALASLPRHMRAIRDHLSPLLPDHVILDGLARVWEEARPEMCLEEGFRCTLAALRHLAAGERREGSPPVEAGEEEVGRLQDEVRALQSRCEECDSALADARYTLCLGREVVLCCVCVCVGLIWREVCREYRD